MVTLSTAVGVVVGIMVGHLMGSLSAQITVSGVVVVRIIEIAFA